MAISTQARAILDALATNHNVVLTGPPAVGKTHLMQEVADAFMAVGSTAASNMPQSSTGPIAIPAAAPINNAGISVPSPRRSNRYVERIAFSANTKHRDFTTAYVPVVGGAGGMSFRVETGALIRANEAALNGAASLLVIDELNRGPAVQLFGDGIVSVDTSKRLRDDDTVGTNSFPMQVLDTSGHASKVYLSNHLYILCSMNQADTSIEPLDVAFLRRFLPLKIAPSQSVARRHLGASGATISLGTSAATPEEVMEALVRAWEAVNSRIVIGRSEDFQIGHGVFMDHPAPTSMQAATAAAVEWWKKIEAHAMEVFYGDSIGAGVVLNAGNDTAGYRLVNASFGDDERQKIVAPTVDEQNIYELLLRVAGS